MRTNISKTIAIIAVGSILLLTVFFQINASYKKNDGHFIYPVDDTYIHMAVAENLANSGQWGLVPNEFSSLSSSILYTLLIAGIITLFGSSEFIPLIINIAGGLGILILMSRIVFRENFKLLTTCIITFSVMYFTPLPALIISGMEHVLQILICGVFVYYSALLLEKNTPKRSDLPFFVILPCLTAMVRFEGIFLVFIISFLFLLRNRKLISLAAIVSGLLPIVILGVISLNNGSYFLPNSLLLKGNAPILTPYGFFLYSYTWLGMLRVNPHGMVLFIGLTSCFIYTYKTKRLLWSRSSVMMIISTFAIILHFTFARTGWFFRYEAYIVFLSILSFSWALDSVQIKPAFRIANLPLYIAGAILGLALLNPLVERANDALTRTVPATNNIYEQQFQMARFLKTYYNHESIGANDIGAISFFTDVKLLDLYGLASKDILVLRIKNLFDQEHIYKVSKSHNVRIAIIYDDWFNGNVPKEWIKLGQWSVVKNVVVGSNTISFYATDENNAETLKRNLKAFSVALPKDVIQQGDYLN
jgi:hypothetical protein